MESPIFFLIIEKGLSTSNACAKRNVDGLLNLRNPMGFLIPFGSNKPMTNQLPANIVPEFHYFQRFRFDWHLVFYSHNESAKFSSQREAAFTQREGQARDFMNRIQRRLGLRQKEMVFFAATEFGDTGSGHLHLLISLDGLRQKGRLEDLASCKVSLPQTVETIRAEMFPKSLKIGCEPIMSEPESQRRLLSYVCKNERGRDYKHCFFSKWINKKSNTA